MTDPQEAKAHTWLRLTPYPGYEVTPEGRTRAEVRS